MKKTIIILGQAGTGKTSLAKAIIGDRKFTELSGLSPNDKFEGITKETAVLFIDEFHRRDLNQLKKLIAQEKLLLSMPHPNEFQKISIERPEIIITSNNLKDEDLKELPKHQNIKIFYTTK